MPTPTGAPSVTDILARQTLALADQISAIRAAVDSLSAQTNALLECVRVLQDGEAQRLAAATARAGAEEARDNGPKMPPVFGRAPSAADAPAIPPIPAALREITVPPFTSEVTHGKE